jgi:hypothetical protein
MIFIGNYNYQIRKMMELINKEIADATQINRMDTTARMEDSTVITGMATRISCKVLLCMAVAAANPPIQATTIRSTQMIPNRLYSANFQKSEDAFTFRALDFAGARPA